MLQFDGNDTWAAWSRHVIIELQSLRAELNALKTQHMEDVAELRQETIRELADAQQSISKTALEATHEMDDKVSKVSTIVNTVDKELDKLRVEFSIKSGIFGIIGGLASLLGTILAAWLIGRIKLF